MEKERTLEDSWALQGHVLDETIRVIEQKWKPHPTQAKIAALLLRKLKRYVLVECGRQWGKTDLAIALAWIWGKLYPGSQSHYFAPYRVQAEDIVWTTRRLQDFGPSEWIRKTYETELRIEWSNSESGYFQLHGADKFDRKRGIVAKNGIIICDEFYKFPEGFWDVFRPSIAKYQCPVLFISSPPESEVHPDDPSKPNQFVSICNMVQSQRNGYYVNAPTSDNPHIPAEEIEEERRRLYSIGMGHIFEREWMAKRVSGGSLLLVPMLNRSRHVRTHGWIREEVERNKERFEFWVVFDPGTTKAFAALFLAWRPETGEIYCLDEIYETAQEKNAASLIWPRAVEIMEEWDVPVSEWIMLYDEAAAWFPTEVTANFKDEKGDDLSFLPTIKAHHRQESGEPRPGLSTFKLMLLNDKCQMSDRCKYLFWEFNAYGLDKNGRLPKKNDHLVDTMMYFINESGYELAGARHLQVQRKESRLERFDAINSATGQIEQCVARYLNDDKWVIGNCGL